MKLLPALRVPGDTEAARATGCSVRLSGSIVCQRGTGIASDIRRYRSPFEFLSPIARLGARPEPFVCKQRRQ
jgi:hypothetical protein